MQRRRLRGLDRHRCANAAGTNGHAGKGKPRPSDAEGAVVDGVAVAGHGVVDLVEDAHRSSEARTCATAATMRRCAAPTFPAPRKARRARPGARGATAGRDARDDAGRACEAKGAVTPWRAVQCHERCKRKPRCPPPALSFPTRTRARARREREGWRWTSWLPFTSLVTLNGAPW